MDEIESVPMVIFGTLLAVLGKRSRPPCMAFLALMRASFSMCSVHETKIKTINASSQACKYDAPKTAREVNTWNPN